MKPLNSIMKDPSLFERLTQSIEKNKHVVSLSQPLPDKNSSLNFIVKEKRHGVSYMSSQLEEELHVIYTNPDELDSKGKPTIEIK